MLAGALKRLPQGLKAVIDAIANGTAEAVPFPRSIYETSSSYELRLFPAPSPGLVGSIFITSLKRLK